MRVIYTNHMECNTIQIKHCYLYDIFWRRGRWEKKCSWGLGVPLIQLDCAYMTWYSFTSCTEWKLLEPVLARTNRLLFHQEHLNRDHQYNGLCCWILLKIQKNSQLISSFLCLFHYLFCLLKTMCCHNSCKHGYFHPKQNENWYIFKHLQNLHKFHQKDFKKQTNK